MKDKTERFELVATTLHGLEQVLAEELTQIDAEDITIVKRAVRYTADKELMYKSNIYLRTAIKVLKPICSFTVRNDEMLYNEVGKIDWTKYMDVNDTLAVDGVVSSSVFNHSMYVALKTKDAIVDQFRRLKGLRPSVDIENPTLRINVHISESDCDLSLDSSGDPLYKRGYRKFRNLAPLNEALAAGMILLSGWDKKSNFVDPMCGSGTIPIEAALIAYNIPPGIYRKEFGFEKWKDFDEDLLRDIADNVTESAEFDYQISGTDISAEFIRFATSNARNAMLVNKILFSRKKMEEFVPPAGGGTVIINPPYGQRILKQDINKFYSMIGERLKHYYAGYNVWVLSSNVDAMKNIALHPQRKISLLNGDLECKFMKFPIYSGSKKTGKNISDSPNDNESDITMKKDVKYHKHDQ
ncbi:MAG: THUMP domain-containing protein [Bacteroidia bacterium]|nr:THUMP domain-containing protein [Bacteroidia bacterium]